MYWKNAKKIFSNLDSIAARLTFFYAISIFLLLAIIASFLYWEMVNILYKADYQFLCDEVEDIRTILQDERIDFSELRKNVIEIPSQSNQSIYRYYIRILDDKKHLLMETPGMSNLWHNHNGMFSTKPKIPGKKKYWWFSDKQKNNYLIIQSPVQLLNKSHHGVIQVVLDISYQHTLINDRKKLIILLGIIMFAAILLGFFIARRGIKSLYDLTLTTKKITASSLHQRIDPKSWPKELRTLGFSFNEMLDRIERSVNRLKQFSADLAHELRTPINNLIGETEIALSHQQSSMHYQQVLESNLEELQRISHIIENLLFLARSENPQMDLQKELLHVNTEIGIVCEYFKPLAEEKAIFLHYKGNATLSANRVMFKRLISNLLSNALKFTPTSGSIHFDIKNHDKTVQITLRDNGIGIANEHLPNIFNRFYRVDSARSHQSGGTGLGLAIVKSIVDLHHGNISVMSELGKGTCVVMSFPI